MVSVHLSRTWAPDLREATLSQITQKTNKTMIIDKILVPLRWRAKESKTVMIPVTSRITKRSG